MIIRPATAADAAAMLEMGRAMHAESPRFQGVPFSDERAAGVVAHFTETPGAFVADRDGDLMGMIAGVVVPHFFSAATYATDLVVYVRPEARGGSAFPRLVRAFEAWAAEAGADECVLGVSTGVHMEATTAMYLRMGYELTATAVRKRVHPGG